ncbi:hypothetical protein NX059_000282 [Plenodomus lindquistii]|nr:hypothetical protein NX059_000282 [Plenodomus lindquistii]
MAPPQASKPVFKTSTPFTQTKWPHIAQDDQETIIDLVCNLIAPIGDHRRAHLHPSKGKKRKRTTDPFPNDTSSSTPPPPPEIGNHILTGLNAITRHLEHLVTRNAPATLLASKAPSSTAWAASIPPKTAPDADELAIVIVTHPKPGSSLAHAHIPTLLHILTISPHAAAPTALALNTKPRLVSLPTSTDGRFANKLGITRVGALAIMQGAPGAKALIDHVRQHVPLTECAWVDEAMTPHWKGASVTSEMSKAAGNNKVVHSTDIVAGGSALHGKNHIPHVNFLALC